MMTIHEPIYLPFGSLLFYRVTNVPGENGSSSSIFMRINYYSSQHATCIDTRLLMYYGFLSFMIASIAVQTHDDITNQVTYLRTTPSHQPMVVGLTGFG